MIKYKTLRWIAAIAWGAVAMILAICALWIFTQLPVEDVIFVSLFAYFIAIGVVMWNTEPTEKPVKQAAKKSTKKADKMHIYTWNQKAREWIEQ